MSYTCMHIHSCQSPTNTRPAPARELQQEGIEQFNAQYGDGDEPDHTIEWHLRLVDRILHNWAL